MEDSEPEFEPVENLDLLHLGLRDGGGNMVQRMWNRQQENVWYTILNINTKTPRITTDLNVSLIKVHSIANPQEYGPKCTLHVQIMMTLNLLKQSPLNLLIIQAIILDLLRQWMSAGGRPRDHGKPYVITSYRVSFHCKYKYIFTVTSTYF